MSPDWQLCAVGVRSGPAPIVVRINLLLNLVQVGKHLGIRKRFLKRSLLRVVQVLSGGRRAHTVLARALFEELEGASGLRRLLIE